MDQESALVLWMLERDPQADSLEFLVGQRWSTTAGFARTRRVRAARLTGLPADTEIEYRLIVDGLRHPGGKFRTAPAASTDRSIRVLLFGDSGWGGSEQVRLARRMSERDWDLSLHVGDLAYENGTETDFTQRHFRVYADLVSDVPVFPAVGNHDLHTDDGSAYDESFEWSPPLPGVRYYSIRWGPALVVVLDTSTPHEDVDGLRAATGRQYEWLEATLRDAAGDSTVTWTIVTMHHPVYSHAVGISGHGGDRRLREALAPLFERWGADLVAAGHDHHYERSTPVLGGRRVAPGCGPVYVVAGAAGASRYARGVGSTSITAAASRLHSFVDLTLRRNTIEGAVIGQDGESMDDFWLEPFPGTEHGRCDG